MNKTISSIVLVLMMVLSAGGAYAHCEVPCGIYDDEMRCDMIAEHITTIEKSMTMIVDISKAPDENYNQLVRWIMNKEEHAEQLQDVVYRYFMTQRVKPVDNEKGEMHEKYVRQLTLLHHMLVFAMKAKQTTDLNNVEKLRTLLSRFHEAYFGKPMQSEHEP